MDFAVQAFTRGPFSQDHYAALNSLGIPVFLFEGYDGLLIDDLQQEKRDLESALWSIAEGINKENTPEKPLSKSDYTDRLATIDTSLSGLCERFSELVKNQDSERENVRKSIRLHTNLHYIESGLTGCVAHESQGLKIAFIDNQKELIDDYLKEVFGNVAIGEKKSYDLILCLYNINPSDVAEKTPKNDLLPILRSNWLTYILQDKGILLTPAQSVNSAFYNCSAGQNIVRAGDIVRKGNLLENPVLVFKYDSGKVLNREYYKFDKDKLTFVLGLSTSGSPYADGSRILDVYKSILPPTSASVATRNLHTSSDTSKRKSPECNNQAGDSPGIVTVIGGSYLFTGAGDNIQLFYGVAPVTDDMTKQAAAILRAAIKISQK